MKQKSLSLVLLVLILFSTSSFSQKNTAHHSPVFLKKPTGEPMATLLNINKISLWANADGRLSYSPHEKADWGTVYPRGNAGVINNKGDGILWGGFVKDGFTPELRVGGQRWFTGTVPGCILAKGLSENPDNPNVGIWRIRPDWQTADLARDAVEFFNVTGDTVLQEDFSFSIDNVTQQQIDAVRAQYEKDWNEWPWQKGAPFYDSNKNGIMDQGELPGLAFADQVIWFANNDLDSNLTNKLFGTPPVGLEEQITLWAYNKIGSALNEAFQNVIFKRVRLIYKGTRNTPDTARIDSMFIAQFTDTDVGSFSDDFAGCDTLLQLGFGYNSTSSDVEMQKFNLIPPAIGYTLLQGPIVDSKNPSEYANYNFAKRKGFTNLLMTSFWHKAIGTAISIDNPDLNKKKNKMYKVMNGYLPLSGDRLKPFYDCANYFIGGGNPTKFMVSGDPVAGTGCIDGMNHVHPGHPGSRRFQMNSGPFKMALGDTQEVIFAIVGGIGSDRLSSVSVMKHYVKWVRYWAQSVFKTGLEDVSTGEILIDDEPLPEDFRLYQNYPNPFNAGTDIRYDLPIQKDVKLTIHNLLGQAVKVLVNNKQDTGNFTVHWDGTDSFGNKLPSGIYFYKLQAGYWVVTKKMMLLQ